MTVDQTRERILDASIALMSNKGFSSTSVREIATKAGVAEMTLFRKFKNKQALLEGITERYTKAFSNAKVFAEAWTYDLETDLCSLSKTYQNFMEENKAIVLLAYKEAGVHNEVSEGLTANPKLMKAHLTEYLQRMQERGLVTKELDIELQVMNFMWMNLGHFSSQFISGNKVSQLPTEQFIESSVKLFVRGLKP